MIKLTHDPTVKSIKPFTLVVFVRNVRKFGLSFHIHYSGFSPSLNLAMIEAVKVIGVRPSKLRLLLTYETEVFHNTSRYF